jgi:hypothetical protein
VKKSDRMKAPRLSGVAKTLVAPVQRIPACPFAGFLFAVYPHVGVGARTNCFR